MYYQVFIDEAYVRDGQAFLEGKVDKNFDCLSESEDGWIDMNGRMLLAEGTFFNASELQRFVKECYPNVDLDVLFVLEFPEKPVLMNWEGDAI